ncbi:MAG TPA: SDR family oxidoreductase [Pseudomonadales bacterium]
MRGRAALEDKVVVVTGASAGVGRASARAFARAGAHVGLIARDPGRLEAASAEIAALGRRACAVPADVADADAVERAADRIEQELGAIDVWVNSAMATVLAPFIETDPDDYRRVTEVTYLGSVNGTRAALTRMLRRDQGTIVQVGSALAYRGIPLQSAYCGAKHAIKGYTESVCSELIARRSRIHIAMVELPAVNTPQFDWARNRLPRRPRRLAPVFQPEVAADAIVFAATARRREVMLGASTVLTVWGNRVAPGLMSRILARIATSGQQDTELDDPARPDNLWQTVPGNQGAHGRFDDEAHDRSLQLWANRHRAWLAAVGVGMLTAALVRRRGAGRFGGT